MKKVFNLLILICGMQYLNAQSYFSISLDGNWNKMDIGSFGFGAHYQKQIDETSWHINWQMTLGGDTDGNLYIRASAPTLLYKSRSYWQYTPDSVSTTPVRDKIGYKIFAAIFPLLCPIGVTYNLKPFNKKMSMGIYANPLIADYWRDNDKVASWTIEGGFKFYFPEMNEGGAHINIGTARINNIYHYENADYRNGWMLNFSLGIGGGL